MAGGAAKKRKTNDGGSQVIDSRFANIHSDPRYRLPSKKQKIKLDSRFKQALKGDAFAKRSKVDRYGRKVENERNRHRLDRKFDFDEDEEASDEPDDDDEVQKELARVEQHHDPLREGKLDASSSDSESETSSEEDSDSEADIAEDEDDAETPREDVPTGEVSKRIAIVNLDWDNIRAQDLMAVFASFLATGDRLLQVAVYPSDFGKERMEREELEGPPKEIFARKGDVAMIGDDSTDEDVEEDDEEDIKASIIKPDDGSEFDSQALRQYQLERLRYFFAVLTFSEEKAAKHIYDAVDGTEYLTTANFFDLRFIPDEMDFSGDKARDACSSLPSDYKPNEFVTDALQHSKVKLTWDQEDRSRKDAQARAFRGGQKEIDENDLKAYLGSDTSSDEEEATEEPSEIPAKSQKQIEREKARALLGFAAEPAKSSRKDKDAPLGNIQVTFASGLSGPTDSDGPKRSVFENSPEPDETTAEKYIRKEKERKQRRKDKMKAQRTGTEPEDDVLLEDAISADQAAEPLEDDQGFDDPFFNDAMNDVAMKNKIRKEERLKKRKEREAEEAASAKQRAELELLMAENDNETAQAAGALGSKQPVRHFDMAEIEKAEKRKGKKDKFKKKHEKGSTNDAAMQDDFKMNVSDPRLGRLFEDHEFAIDPTNQKLKQTSGMKQLIEENRKRRHGSEKLPSTSAKPSHANKKFVKASAKSSKDSEVRDLVAKLKRKTT